MNNGNLTGGNWHNGATVGSTQTGTRPILNITTKTTSSKPFWKSILKGAMMFILVYVGLCFMTLFLIWLKYR